MARACLIRKADANPIAGSRKMPYVSGMVIMGSTVLPRRDRPAAREA